MEGLSEQEQKYFDTQGEVAPEEAPAEVAPAAEAAPVEAPQAEPEAAPPVEQPKQESSEIEKVKAALSEARFKNRELNSRLQRFEQEQAEIRKRLEATQSKLEPSGPTMETDPASYLKQKVETNEQELAHIRAQEQQRQQLGQFHQWYAGKAQEFRAQQPDFDQAYAAYNRTRVEQLANAGLSEQQVEQRLQFEEMQLAATAAQSGMNPAQVIYQLSLARGYKPTPKAPAAAERLEMAKKGVESSRPMGSVGGGGQTVNMTWEAVANMPSGPEFQKAWDQMMKQEGHA